jgi:hypothetical protein
MFELMGVNLFQDGTASLELGAWMLELCADSPLPASHPLQDNRTMKK